MGRSFTTFRRTLHYTGMLLATIMRHAASRIGQGWARRRLPGFAVLPSPGAKRALVSYLLEPLTADDDARVLRGHSNMWESREICRLLHARGYHVDVMDYRDFTRPPADRYSLMLDISPEHMEWVGRQSVTIEQRLLHLTESYARFAMAAESARIESLLIRTGHRCRPRRPGRIDVDRHDAALRQVDHFSLIGNATTLASYPEWIVERTHLVTVSGTWPLWQKPVVALVPDTREYLWFGGMGAVHKGLDLVIEVFARHPEWKLHIVGALTHEYDFFQAVARWLFPSPNIEYHGFLLPESAAFRRLASRIYAFIFPSCSESISAAAVTCLQTGFYPVISRETGVDLPAGRGCCLSECSTRRIEEVLTDLHRHTSSSLTQDIVSIQAWARDRYSRAAFSHSMGAYLNRVLPS